MFAEMSDAQRRVVREALESPCGPVAFFLLREDEKQDVLHGRCVYREYEGTPILDYSNAKSPAITRERFIDATGREPADDDLERSNCPKAGQDGHLFGGWDWVWDRPKFETELGR